jgi:hypothetical protein
MNTDMQGSSPRIPSPSILRPAWRARLLPSGVCLLLIGFLGFRAGPLITGVSGVLGRSGTVTAAVALVGIVVGAALVYFLLYFLTVSAEFGPAEIARRSIFGRKALALPEIVSAVRSNGGLDVRTARQGLSFAAPFTAGQRQEIHDHVCEQAAAAARPVQTTRPPPAARRVLIVGVLSGIVLLAAILLSLRL